MIMMSKSMIYISLMRIKGGILEGKKTRLREETKGGMSEMEQGRKREDVEEINRSR